MEPFVHCLRFEAPFEEAAKSSKRLLHLNIRLDQVFGGNVCGYLRNGSVLFLAQYLGHPSLRTGFSEYGDFRRGGPFATEWPDRLLGLLTNGRWHMVLMTEFAP